MWGIVVLSTFVSLTVFVLACAGLQLGVWLEMILPREHLTSEARSTAQIGIGMMATLAALVLGLMITSAKSSFDRVTEEVVDVSTSIVLIDRSLAGYGDDARQARTELRDFAVLLASDVSHFSQIKAASSHDPSQKPLANLSTITALQLTILALHPTNDSQRWFQTRALSISAELGHQRVLTAEQGSRTLPATLLVVLTSWVVLIFVGLGVFTVGNHSVRAALVFLRVCVCRCDLLDTRT